MCCQRAAHRTRNAKSVHVNILQIMKNCMNQNVLFQSLNVMIAYYDFSRILYKFSILKIEFDYKCCEKSIMVKYGKVSDREVQQCFHARMITIITVNVEFSRVLVFTMLWHDFFNFCKYDRFLVLLSHHLYFVVYFV